MRFVAGLIDIAVIRQLVDRVPGKHVYALHLGCTSTFAPLHYLLHIDSLGPIGCLSSNCLIDAALERRETREIRTVVNRCRSVVVRR